MNRNVNDDMVRVNRIVKHPLFIENIAEIQQIEANRIFCRHSIEHLLDTARIMYIYSLENRMMIKKESIYAAALLHDIGRAAETKTGVGHDIAGISISETILEDCGFDKEEVGNICSAIFGHRSVNDTANKDVTINDLKSLLTFADKKSRLCFQCNAVRECYWSEQKKNKCIEM